MFGLVTWYILLISWRQATETPLDVWFGHRPASCWLARDWGWCLLLPNADWPAVGSSSITWSLVWLQGSSSPAMTSKKALSLLSLRKWFKKYFKKQLEPFFCRKESRELGMPDTPARECTRRVRPVDHTRSQSCKNNYKIIHGWEKKHPVLNGGARN